MKVIEKPWHYGTYLAYDETEEIFIPTERGVRVLPAPFFYDKKLYFELKATYAPGEKPTFPNGGYEVSVAFCEPEVDDLLTTAMQGLLAG